MPTISVYDMTGKETGTLELSADVFGIEPNVAVMHSDPGPVRNLALALLVIARRSHRAIGAQDRHMAHRHRHLNHIARQGLQVEFFNCRRTCDQDPSQKRQAQGHGQQTSDSGIHRCHNIALL